MKFEKRAEKQKAPHQMCHSLSRELENQLQSSQHQESILQVPLICESTPLSISPLLHSQITLLEKNLS